MIANDRELSAVIHNLNAAHATLGRPVPAKITKALDAIDAQCQTATSYTGPNLRAATVAAVVAGRDIVDDEDVKRALTARALATAGAESFIADGLHERRVNVLRDNYGDLFEVWGEVVEKASETIDEAQAAIPDLDFDRTDPARLSAQQAFHWAGARQAMLHVRTVESMWLSLAKALGLAYVYEASRPLITAALGCDDIRKLGYKAGATNVIKAGHPLHLADIDEYQRRVAALHDEEAERQRASRRFVEPQNFTGKLTRT